MVYVMTPPPRPSGWQWHSVTVGKAQQIYDILQGLNFEHEIDRKIQLLAVLDDKPAEHFAAMPIPQLIEEAKRVKFLYEWEVPKIQPPKLLKAGRRIYQPMYEFYGNKFTGGQMIDAVSAIRGGEELIPRLNWVLAHICVATRRNWRGRRVALSYGAVPFEEVAEDMLSASLPEVQAIADFFMQVWIDFLRSMPDFLRKMMETMAPEQREKMEAVLLLVGAGSPAPAT